MALKQLRSWLAGGPRPAEDAVLVLMADARAAEQAAPVIDGLTSGRWRLSVVLIAPDASGLAVRHPGADVRSPCGVTALTMPAIFAALRVRSVLLVGPKRASGVTSKLMSGARGRGVPVYALPSDGAGGALIACSDNAPPAQGQTPDQMAQTLARAIGVERAPGWSLDALAGWVKGTPLRTALKGVLHKIDTLEALKADLGAAATILCLGNGPSSVRPALAEVSHDALFRVNHDWRSCGFLDQPDMVFAGVKRSMRKLGAVRLGVANARKEQALIACRGFEPWHGLARYAVVDEVAAAVITETPGVERPTTGAYMLAAAVALQPATLVVAGMDMFSDPQGAYADGADANAYTPAHGRTTDAAFITACLEHYRGHLVSFSPAFSVLVRDMENKPFSFDDRSDP